MNPYEIIGSVICSLDAEKDIKVSDMGISLKFTLFTRLAFHSPRTPLISDNDSYIFDSVLKTIPKPERMIVSLETSNIMDKFNEAAEKGLTMIIIDVEKLTPNLQFFLRMARSNDGKATFDIGQRKVKVSEQFRLILFTPLPMNDVPENLKSVVTPVDFSKFSKGFPRDVIERAFIMKYNTKELSTIADPCLTRMQKLYEINTTEKDLLEIINDIRTNQKEDINYVLVEDNETFTSLLTVKKLFIGLISEDIDYEELSDKKKVVLHPYENAIDICESMWLSLSRYLPRVSNLYSFSFSGYMEMINQIISEVTEIEKLPRLFIASVEQKYFKSMTMRDSIFFMLICSFFNNCRHGFTHESDLQVIAQHIQAEYDGRIQMFGPEPGRSSFDQMKFVNILGLYKLATSLICDNFDEHFLEAIPMDSIPLDQPIVILKNTGRTLKLDIDDEECLEFTYGIESDYLTLMKSAITRARIHGNRVIVYYDSPNPSIATFINDNIDAVNTQPPNEKFQLIISCSTSEYIPHSVMSRCVVLQTREPVCVAQTMRHLKPVICSSTDFQLHYAIATVFAIQNVRAFLGPCGLFNAQFVNVELIKSVMERLKFDKITVPAARKITESIVSNSFCYKDDCDKVIAHLKKIINPDITDDIFTFTRSQLSAGSPWIIPKDNKGYDEVVSHLPVLPAHEVLCVDRSLSSITESWSLSRWLSEPFMTLARDSTIDSTAKLSSILVTIPDPIEIPLTLAPSPASIIAKKEARIYNETIKAVKQSVQNPTKFTHMCVANDISPPEWGKAAHINAPIRIAAFFRALIARREFIDICVKTRNLPKRIDANSCSDVKALVSAVCASVATNFSEQDAVFELERASDSPLALDGVAIVGWGFDPRSKQLSQPTKVTKPSSKMFTLHLRAQPSSSEMMIVPILLTIGPNTLDNYVARLAIRGDLSYDDMIINGVCAVLHLPSSFEE
ncbi:hypothetical protein TVAG_276290 [Trichomonas vaginalis G3]|uniref:Dynein heavy chain ATP-binding dynein motor region domain-containing protein n=1 Tax=Trichomonas vaginalis (strain ATCC PRA-98 / G3) TaxID=412133 RepID=A2ECR0_TRIV3|nr:dynein heavy chain family protein family [Trichomonas vaginalis G3]EAY09556.1 hypothetical protein TVAG_276290 [Trichomonas vaginalis G3]KAI5533184.1 dynein heavy chain family protein family [Trichomonas vaginalis G3]|eukprot:XP_001321779.1 hypothetical protein [Trichomonas vaginalis G3]